MIEKILTLLWFFKRPVYWEHALNLIKRKFLINYDTPFFKKKSINWARENVVSYRDAFKILNINGDLLGLNSLIVDEGNKLVKKSAFKLGGAGDINLLFDLVRLLGANKVIETGVAYGWSSLAILNAMELNNNGNLISVDMPYPKMGNEKSVGIVVPEYLKKRWSLIREPDRRGIIKAIKIAGGEIDLCHYDSDKNWWGRAYAFPLLWSALKHGGLFISDDIQDNMFFAEFVTSKSIPYAVIKTNEKFVGIMRKVSNL